MPEYSASSPTAKSPSNAGGEGGALLRLPQNLDAERSVLGSMLLDNGIIPDIMELVGAEDFHQASHQVIFRRLVELYDAQKPVELTTLSDLLRRHNELDATGGYLYLANLEQFVVSTGVAAEHAGIVREKSLLRRLMVATETIRREASEERQSAPEIVEMAEKLIFDVSHEVNTGTFSDMEEMMEITLEEITSLYGRHGATHGLQTGFLDLDKLIGGFDNTALVILAARPSIGKTAFALNIVRNVAMNNIPVAVFSMEMGKEQLNMRLLCSEARLSAHKIKTGYFRENEFQMLKETAARMSHVPILIDDTAGLTLLQLRSRARRLKAQRPDLGLIVVDYLQLMQSPSSRRESNRQQEVAEMSRGLKILAKELRVPVVALSQLSRNIEQRGTKKEAARPMLSDLRESGSIEQDADIVMFIHRERTETMAEKDGQRIDKNAPIPSEIIVGKNRNGPTGTADMLFFPDITRFGNLQIG
jgi:replicative DNA helicase